jgi:hypothetical protein
MAERAYTVNGFKRGTRTMFTINNPNHPNDKPDFGVADEVNYAIYQLERGAGGTLHYQGILNVVDLQLFIPLLRCSILQAYCHCQVHQ